MRNGTGHGRFCVTNGRRFRLKDFDPGETEGLEKEAAQDALREGIGRLGKLQERLYAQDRWGLLVIFQAMDAAGKDGTIKHVLSGINPMGVQVSSFKAPSSEELDHDYLWRTSRRLPERGRIGIFNRSYYEETLVVRVHEAILGGQHLPASVVTPSIWKERYEDINAFERYLSRNGFVILKFFLHVSKAEQKRRFLSRLDEPEKYWKFSIQDVEKRRDWDKYMKAYEDTIRATSTSHAPWHIVPADRKWFTRLVVADTIVSAMERLKPEFPTPSAAEKRALARARRALERKSG